MSEYYRAVPNPKHPLGGCGGQSGWCRHNVPPLRTPAEKIAFRKAWDARVEAGR